jgi:hypothetical protein
VTEVYGRKIRDDLRPGTPLHLYLPGPHRGVVNAQALQASQEIILTEALIDALTFWCAGYRNVTSAYGIEGLTDEIVAAFKAHGIERVLIAFDRDEAGERGARKAAERLLSEGIDCYRIEFPKGMDANEYASKVTPAAKSLGVLIRKAVWLGQGRPKPITTVAVAGDVLAPAQRPALEGAALPSLAADPAAHWAPAPSEATPAAKEETPALPAAVVPEGARDVAAAVKEHEVVLAFGEGSAARRWRMRGLPKSPVFETLKVNVLAAMGERFHVDTFDLYHARARASFVTHAAVELQVAEDILKADLGRVLLKLEALQEEQLRQALESRKPATVEMAEADRAAALELLRAPDLLARIVADFDACGLVGEATNKLVGYLAAVSRKLASPLAVVIQSSSAAGKSSLMDAVLAFMPEEERVKYSAMTGQSLFYMGETNLKHKILAICEEEGASRAAYALKLLQSDGELTIASTGKDPDTGNLITQQYRVEGPVMILLTTTAIEIDEELLNRCLVLSVDEGRSQTEAIHALQRRKRTLEGLLARQEREHLARLHQNAQRLLRPLAVVNPWADRLTFLSDKTRTRRDHEKYLTLIDVIALLHQHQREVKTTTHRGQVIEYVEATLDDIGAANAIAHEVLGHSLDELPPQTRRLLGAIVEHVQAESTRQAIRRGDVRFTRKALRVATGWGDTQLKVHLARLVDLEFVIAHRAERGQGYVYELLYDGDAHAAVHLSGLIDLSALQSQRYDAERSGLQAPQSAPGRAAVGARSGGGRSASLPAEPATTRAGEEATVDDAPMHVSEGAHRLPSYPHPPVEVLPAVLPLAASAA